mgnify:CR=1 FL=1
MKTIRLLILVVLACSFFHRHALADQFHYQNFVIGDRAIGLGGAYGGVSDDASGVFYNPAGSAFALSNDISGSANAMYNKKVVFKETIGGQDFVESSSGSVPSFFGGLLKIDHILEGLVFAWGIYSLDSELKDQDDLFKNITLSPGSPCEISGGGTGPAAPDNVLKRFHRTVNSRGATEYIGASLGWRFSNSVAVGFGANYVKVDELIQEYQDVKQSSKFCKTDGSYEEGTYNLTQNIRQQLTAYGLQPVLGIQASLFGRLSIGLTLKFGTYFSQNFEQTREARVFKLLNSHQTAIEDNSRQSNDLWTIQEDNDVLAANFSPGEPYTEEKPLGSMPGNYRLGLAYFASPRMLLALDLVHVASVTDASTMYRKDAVTNMNFGIEYYVMPAVPVRLGVFTNNDARPTVIKNKVNQRNHIDYIGSSLFASWVQPNSQIGAGIVLQNGSGDAQKIGGSQSIQDVEAQSFTFAFSATTTL